MAVLKRQPHTWRAPGCLVSPRPTAIDLFAGPGGLSLGLKAAGFDIVAAIERDGDAGRTYKHNVGTHTFTQDITAFGPDELREALGWEEDHTVDLVAGGPPCPGFSLIGRSKIMDLIKKGKWRKQGFSARIHRRSTKSLFLEFGNLWIPTEIFHHGERFRHGLVQS